MGEWVKRRVEGRYIIVALGITIGEEPYNLVKVRELYNLAEERELRIVVVGVGHIGVVAKVHHIEAGHKVVAVVVLYMAVVHTGAAKEELYTEVADHRGVVEEHCIEAVDRTTREEAHCIEAVEEEEHYIVVVYIVVEGILYYCQLVPCSIQLFISHLQPGSGALYL